MAFADLMIGALSLPSYLFLIGNYVFQLCTATISMPLDYFFATSDTILTVASLTSAASKFRNS